MMIIHDSWNIRHNRQFSIILSHFLTFDPPNNLKNQQFKKKKKKSGDINLHLHATNDIIWCILPDIWSVTDNFLSLRAIFCPFTLVTTQKTEIWKKYKKFLDMLSFYIFVPQIKIIRWMVHKKRCTTDRDFCDFGPFFALWPS